VGVLVFRLCFSLCFFRNKIVLSNIYLAMQIVSDPRYELDEKSIRNILENIFNLTQKITWLRA